MMRYVGRGMLVAVAGLLLVAAARADEEKVPLDKLPRAVVEAVKKRFPDAQMVSADKEKENGKTIYEVNIKNKGRSSDVSLTEDGALVSIETQIPAADLPKAVADTLEQKYPKAEVKVREEVIHVRDGKEKLEYYEFQLVTADGKKLEVTITPDGKINKESGQKD